MPISYVAGQMARRSPVSASARDSGRQISPHTEICMGIDELKPNRYVGPKTRSIYYSEFFYFLGCAPETGQRKIIYRSLQVPASAYIFNSTHPTTSTTLSSVHHYLAATIRYYL